ncbi:hypothetical protein [Gordonia sp. 'Campus']|uniref:hypothetical protein n=1 Tax=Gordonia sp. 'Campus' TaxID=2915824 RepID=UPI001EE3A6B5|nr:hypothetical protein [Gordonia sp. 'Campus']
MTDFSVNPGAVGGASTSISAVASTIEGYTLTSSFSTLTGAFAGATNPMAEVAGSGDRQVTSSLNNAAGAVTAFSEMITSFKNATVELDGENAAFIRQAVSYPAGPA